MRADLARATGDKELDAWKSSGVFELLKAGDSGKSVVDTRRVCTWEMVEGVKTVQAHSAAKGFQDPELKAGAVDASGCACYHSSHFQVIPTNALKKWTQWCLDIKNACGQADVLSRDVCCMPQTNGGPRTHSIFGN